jgi:hypothetical protein
MRQLLNKLLQRYHSNDHSLIGAMEEVIESYADSKRRLDYSPYHWLPNVASVKMEVKPWSFLFALFGIKKREGAATMRYVEYKNDELNRYLLRQINRLKSNRFKPAYWAIANHILKRSNVFFLVALKHVLPRWHRDFPFWAIMRLRRDYLNLVETKAADIDYRRVYIEKSNGKWRGLGVPTLVWRLYLHQINQLLTLAFEPYISEEQHGFRPMRGTLTAWLSLLKKIHNFDNIYEFDYASFFPNLDILEITDRLQELGVPSQWVFMIQTMNKSQPKLPVEEKMDESQVRYHKRLKEGNKVNNFFLNSIDWGNQSAFAKMNLDLTDWKVHIDHHPIIGVPQGAPTSPFLSILCLDWAIRKDIGKTDVRYADDGLRLTNGEAKEPIETNEMRLLNIKYAREKCGFVKKNGKWLKELKFLGLVYNAERDELRSDTREGAKLIYDKQSLVDILHTDSFYKGIHKDYPEDNPHSWENFIKSDLTGFILSRLYIGDWNLTNYVQSFKLTRKEGSWVSCYNKFIKRKAKQKAILKDLLHIKLNVFNSSSLCLKSALEAFKEIDRKTNRMTKKTKR